MPSEVRFIARSYFEQGTRPLFSGARPSVRFDDLVHTAEVSSEEVEIFPTAKWVDVEVRVPFFEGGIRQGREFTFVVGAREIGKGIVSTILDP